MQTISLPKLFRFPFKLTKSPFSVMLAGLIIPSFVIIEIVCSQFHFSKQTP